MVVLHNLNTGQHEIKMLLEWTLVESRILSLFTQNHGHQLSTNGDKVVPNLQDLNQFNSVPASPPTVLVC